MLYEAQEGSMKVLVRSGGAPPLLTSEATASLRRRPSSTRTTSGRRLHLGGGISKV